MVYGTVTCSCGTFCLFHDDFASFLVRGGGDIIIICLYQDRILRLENTASTIGGQFSGIACQILSRDRQTWGRLSYICNLNFI